MMGAAVLWSAVLLAMNTAMAEEGPCSCPDQNQAAVFSAAEQVFVARSGDQLPSELTPLFGLKGALPERAYIAETWEACDLEAGAPRSTMLVVVGEHGQMSRCGGAGPLPDGDAVDGMQTDALQSWLRYGGWMSVPPPTPMLLALVERELRVHPLQPGESGVAISGVADLDERLPSGAPVWSQHIQEEGPRWMTLHAMSGPDGLFFVHWQHARGAAGSRVVWESQGLWQWAEDDLVLLWQTASPQQPVLSAPPSERLGMEVLQGTPQVAALDNGEAVVVVPGQELHALVLDPRRGWQTHHTLDEQSSQVLMASDDAHVAIAWQRGDAMWVQRFVSGEGWASAEAVVHGAVSNADISVNSRGEILVLWTDATGGVWGRRMDAQGAWEDAHALADDGGHDVHGDLSDRGQALAVWLEGGMVRARLQDRKGHWGRVRALSHGPSPTQPRLQMDRWGRAVVVWGEGEGRSALVARTHHALRGWQPDVSSLTTNRRGELSTPAVVVQDGGGAIVFWLQGGTRAMLWAQVYTSRRGWQEPQHVLLQGDVDITAPPQVASQGDGTVCVAWKGRVQGWTGMYTPGAGFGRLAIFDDIGSRPQTLSIDAFAEQGCMFLWSEGERPMEIWVRSQP